MVTKKEYIKCDCCGKEFLKSTNRLLCCSCGVYFKDKISVISYLKYRNKKLADKIFKLTGSTKNYPNKDDKKIRWEE